MNPTPHPEINRLLSKLLTRLQEALPGRLTGLYLYGSLVWGDFDFEISDIDLMAALCTPIVEPDLPILEGMHAAFALAHPVWENRIEVAYCSLEALQTFKTRRSPIAVISPGEPLNLKDAGYDWLVNWYIIREKGVALCGSPHFGSPPAAALIAPVSHQEFNAAGRLQAAEWRDWVSHTRQSRPYQGYAILTLCRALYAVRTGDQPSKLQAARWAMAEYPDWADQIRKALEWRADPHMDGFDHTLTYSETERFVRHFAELVEAAPPA